MPLTSSEDEFDQQIKQRCVLGKENVDPKHSPLMHKLTEISFNSSDFENDCSKEHVQKLNNVTNSKVPKKKVKLGKKKQEPYQSLRVQRPGMTMFDMMKATDTPEKVVIFLQERGC